MVSLSNQLSSLRDDRNKNLKRFISHYKSNIKWNNIEVYKAWQYFLSINNQFDKCESLFSEIIHGNTLLSLNNTNVNDEYSDSNNIIMDQPKDIDFLTSDELDNLKTNIRTFIELSVPYFLSNECHHLIGYLIYKYNISVSFSEFLIVSYIQYHYSENYCKLLSLLALRNDSTFHSFYNELKSISMNFTDHKYIKSNVVFSVIAKNFSVYKQISSCYDRLAIMCTMNSNIISFLNTLNFHYLIVNSKVMDNNEIRYVVNLLKDSLSHFDKIEYLSSYLCQMITMFTHIQFTVAVQRDLLLSLKPIMSLLDNLKCLKIDHLIFFKYIIMSIHLMLHYQNQTLDKLPQEITNSLIDILQKHETLNIVFNNLKQIKGFDFSRTINVTLNSLVSSLLGNTDLKKEVVLYVDNSNIPSIDRLHFFLKFVNDSFDSSYMKMIVFNLIDEVNRISSHVRSHGDSIISFDESSMIVNINKNHKFSSTLVILYSLFKIINNINPTVLEYSINDYLNTLTFEMLQYQIEVILFIFSSISDDIMFRMLILLSNHSKQMIDNNEYYKSLDGIGGMNMMFNMFGLIQDKKSSIYNDEKLFNSLLEFIISMYSKTESHSTDFNLFVFNFINNSMNDEFLSNKLESYDIFWNTLPVKISTESLVYNIQKLIDSTDMKFKYGEEAKVDLQTIDFKHLLNKDYKYIFSPYINHISKSNDIFRIFRIYKLILKINNEFNFEDHQINITKSLRRFIYFITILDSNRTNEFNSFTDNFNCEKELIELNNDIIHEMCNLISEINNDKHFENDNGYSVDNYGTTVISNSIIFNIFSSLYYQYLTIEMISNSNSNLELLHSQFVVITDLILKYVTNNVDTQTIKEFVIDFYKFIICKYGSNLLLNSKRFNDIIVIKSIETIISNKELNCYVIKILPYLFSITNLNSININIHLEHIKLLIEVIRINNITKFNESFSICYLYDNNKNLTMNVNVPINYKNKFLNVDLLKLIRESHITNIISNSHKNNNSINYYFNDINNQMLYGKVKQQISLFDNINDDMVDNCIEIVLNLFKMSLNNELSGNLFFEILITTLDMTYDSSYKYSKKILNMLIQLSKLCQNTIVTYDYFELPISHILNNKYNSMIKSNIVLKYDIKIILNTILLASNDNVDTIDHFTNVISEFLIKDNGFFNIFISNAFISSNIIYNMNFIVVICSTISNCEHSLEVLFSFLDGMIDYLFNILSEDNNDIKHFVTVFQDVFTRYYLILYSISKLNQRNSINNLLKYVEHCTHLLNICSIYLSTKTELNNKSNNSNNGYNEMSQINSMVNNTINIFDKITFLLLYSLNNGTIWILPLDYRNRLYTSFSLYYSQSNTNYLNTLINDIFEINDVDDKVLLQFIYYLISNFYREDVLLYIINNIKSIKTYEIMIYMIKNSNKIDIVLKTNLICKIINNVLVSTDIENKKVQSFLFTNLNCLIEFYLKLVSDDYNNDLFSKLNDSKLEKQLKTLSKSIDDSKERFDNKYNIPNKLKKLITDLSNKHKNFSINVDNDDIISLLSLIVNQINGMIDNVYRMDLNNSSNISKMFNELYHNSCTLINITINKYRQSFKLLNKLINNLIVCSIRIQHDSSINTFEETVRSTVIDTITNILGDMKSEYIVDLVNILIDDNETSFADDSIYLTWISYLIYLFFNLSINHISTNIGDKRITNNDVIDQSNYKPYSIITDILNSSDKWISILYNIIWIHQVIVFDPVNKYGLQINKFVGYNSINILFNSNRVDDNIYYDLANVLYGYISYYIQNYSILNIKVDVEFFNNINSVNRILFIELNELLYSLLSSIVFYKHVDIRNNKHLKSNQFNSIQITSDISTILNLITSSIIQIFNMVQLEGFNLYIYGMLNTLLNNNLDEIVNNDESSSNVWDNIFNSGIKYHYHLHIISTLISLQNKISVLTYDKDNTIMIKYQRELQKFHNISSIALFDFIKHSENMYLKNENEDSFNQISHMKTYVWEYFVKLPPKSVDSFIEILEHSFDLIRNHHKNNDKLLWSYLDMIYSFKVIINMCICSDNVKLKSKYHSNENTTNINNVVFNDVKKIGGIETKKLVGGIDISYSGYNSYGNNNYDSNVYNNLLGTNYTIETKKMISSIRKFMEVYNEFLISNKSLGEFVNTIFLLFLLCVHKFCNSILNKEFYDFSLNLILNYDSNSKLSNSIKIENVDYDLINNLFKQYLFLKIDDCINSITESYTKRYKYFNNEMMLSHILYYTSIKIDIKTLIRSIYTVYNLSSDSFEYYNTSTATKTVVSKKTKKSMEFKQTKLIESYTKTKTTSLDSSNSQLENSECIIYKLTILLLSLSYNISNKKPKNKYIDDLNHIYFIVVNFYSKYSYKLLFGKSEDHSFNDYNSSNFNIDDIVQSSRMLSTSLFIKNTSMLSLSLFELSFVSFIINYFGLISSNKLLDILENQSKMLSLNVDFTSNDNINKVVEIDLKNRLLFIVLLSSLHEYGNLGATNLIMTRLYQNIEHISDYCISESRYNREFVDNELSFQNTWTWFTNCRFILQLIQMSIDTWNAHRSSVPDVILNSWVKIIKDFISLFDILPINAEIEVDNLTNALSITLENTLSSLINGFITQDDKLIKIESCLSDHLPTKSLNVKIGSLVIMNKLWDELGINLSLTIKNVMPIIGELVDDENEIVRRLAIKLDGKVNEILYHN